MGKKSRSIRDKAASTVPEEEVQSSIQEGEDKEGGAAIYRAFIVGVDNDGRVPFTTKGVYYTKPLEERLEPDMSMHTIKTQYLPKLYTTSSECSATAIRHQEAARLFDQLNTSLHADSGSDPEVFVYQCVLLIRGTFLTDSRVLSRPDAVLHKMGIGSIVDSITESYPMSSITDMQLVDELAVKEWVTLLADAIVLAASPYSLSHTLNVVQELRAQSENGALTGIDGQHLGITGAELRFVLSNTGIQAACFLYQNGDIRRQQEQLLGVAAPTSAFLLDSIEVLAYDLINFCPESPMGHWWLGYLARESVAKRKWHGLKGAAVCLKHMTDCYKAADAQDDDFYRALGRIEAALCHCLGGSGIVEYEVNTRTVQVMRDFGCELPVPPTANNSAQQKEKKRICDGIRTTHIASDETLLVPRWEVLRLWNEAMRSYDALEKWGHHFYVFGKASGWRDVTMYLNLTRDHEGGSLALAVKYPDSAGGWGFEATRMKGFHLCGRCLVCGKKGGNGVCLMKCSRCQEATYCSRECQAKDWKTHKQTCTKQK